MHVHPHTRTHIHACTHANIPVMDWRFEQVVVPAWLGQEEVESVDSLVSGWEPFSKEATHTHNKQLKYIIFIIISWFISRIRLSIDVSDVLRTANTEYNQGCIPCENFNEIVKNGRP